MNKRFIMTAFATDRTGLVADITRVVYDNGCNLEDTEMTQLEDEFALMLLFTGDAPNLEEQIAKDCRRLEREKNITAFVRQLKDTKFTTPKATATCSIHAQGIDQAGIVYKISRFLASQGINISRLTSRKAPSPESGTPIYSVTIDIEIPGDQSMETLEHGLADLGHEIDIHFEINKNQ